MALSKRLYRLLYRSSKSIRDVRNRQLLISTIDHCQDLSRLTFINSSSSSNDGSSNKELYCFKNDTLHALRYCFKYGSMDNIEVTVSLLPRLNRYFKAATVIQRYMDNNDNKDTMLAGAMLVSQLYHNSKVNENEMLREVNDGIDSIVFKTIQELEMNKLSSNLLEVVIDDIQNHHIVLQDEKYDINGHYYRIVDILKALNKVLDERESNRIKGNSNRIIHLVDQIFHDKNVRYKDAMPMVYAVISSEVLSRLYVDILGAAIQSIFLAKICENGEVGDADRSISVANNKVNAKDIVGSWVSVYPTGLQEVTIDFIQNNIVATKVDGDVYIPANATTWKFKIPDDIIECNVDYPGELQVAKENFSKPKMKRCKIRFLKIESSKNGTKSHHYEIIMNPMFEVGAEEVASIDEDNEELIPQRNDTQQWDPTLNYMYFFKTNDLTNVFFDFNERGAVPMSNFVLEGMIKRYSLNKKQLNVIPKVSTSDYVASRMIADIYRNTVRRNINAENINYWGCVSRQIETLLSKET